jgi:hypothetical protein
MKIKIVKSEDTNREEDRLCEFELTEAIPIPEGKDIHIYVPDGVFRCNINEGIFPEDRRFFQRSASDPRVPNIIRYNEISHLQNPRLSIRLHYPGRTNEDVVIEFRQPGENSH